MDWLLAIVLMTQAGAELQEPALYATRDECMTAAADFVERYPAFELIDRSKYGVVERPVMRSTVECVSADSRRRRDRNLAEPAS